MIIGIGTDICDIRRIENSIQKFGDRFKSRIFTEGERQYCDEKSGAASYYAKRFAAKEAVAKALAGQTTGSLSWHDVEVIKDPSGRPTAMLHGGALKRMQGLLPKGYEGAIFLSLSDDFPYAQAFAIFEAKRVGESGS